MGNVVLAIVWYGGLLIVIVVIVLLIGLYLWATGDLPRSKDE
jgi:hypothetical protein